MPVPGRIDEDIISSSLVSEDHYDHTQPLTGLDQSTPPHEYESTNGYFDAPFWSKINWSFMTSVLARGTKRHALGLGDFHFISERDSAEVNFAALEKEWESEVAMARKENYETILKELATEKERTSREGGDTSEKSEIYVKIRAPSINRALFRAFGWPLFMWGLTLMFYTSMKVGIILFLNALITFVNSEADGANRSDWEGYFYAIGMATCSLCQLVVHHQYFFHTPRIGYQMKAAIQCLLYSRTLKMTSATLAKTTIGNIVTVTASDPHRYEDLATAINYIWNAPIEAVIILYIIYREIGLIFLYGIAIFAILIGLQFLFSKYFSTIRKNIVKSTDIRVKITNELLHGIEVVKMSSLEPVFEEMIQQHRDEETKHLQYNLILRGLNMGLYSGATSLISMVTFLAQHFHGGVLSSSVVFTVMSAYEALSTPLIQFLPGVIELLVVCQVSGSRIDRVLLLAENVTNLDDTGEVTMEQLTAYNENSGSINSEKNQSGKYVELSHLSHHDAFSPITSPTSPAANLTPGMICIDNVTFSWPEPESPSLDVYAQREVKAHTLPSADTHTSPHPPSATATGGVEHGMHADIYDERDGDELDDVSAMSRGRTESATESSGVSSFPNIRVALPEGGLTAIVGSVGSGKTSLLYAILGELPVTKRGKAFGWEFLMKKSIEKVENAPQDNQVIATANPVHFDSLPYPYARSTAHSSLFNNSTSSAQPPQSQSVPAFGRSVFYSGAVSFASQKAYLLPISVRDNILFGLPYDANRYAQTLYACALARDISIFPAGDATQIAEGGNNLSGGQKARIALARAVYRDADVYLFDDVLAAVDPIVARHIFTHVMGPHGLLRNRTRVVVTHQAFILPVAERVVVMRNGRVCGVDRYAALVARGVLESEADARKTAIEAYESRKAETEGFIDGEGELEPGTSAAGPRLSKIAVSGVEAGEEASSEIVTPIAVASAVNPDDLDAADLLSPNGSSAVTSPIPLELTFSSMSTTQLSASSSAVDESLVPALSIKRSSNNFTIDRDQFKAAVDELKVLLGKRNNEKATSQAVVTAEGKADGAIGLTTYYKYFVDRKVLVSVGCLLLLLLPAALKISADTWLAAWCRQDAVAQGETKNAVVYLVLGVLSISASLTKSICILLYGLLSSKQAYTDMLRGVLFTSLSFFQSQHVGRLLNRFSRELAILDEMLPITFLDAAQVTVTVFASFIVIGVILPSVLLVLPIIVPLFYWARTQFIGTSREIKRLDAVTKSPYISLLTVSLSGLPVLRTFEFPQHLNRLFSRLIDANGRVAISYHYCARWLAVRLDMLCVMVSLCAGISCCILKNQVSGQGSGVGIVLLYINSMATLFQWALRQTAEVENQMTSAERVREYGLLLSEFTAHDQFTVEKRIYDKMIVSDRLQTHLVSSGTGSGTHAVVDVDLFDEDTREDASPVKVDKTGDSSVSVVPEVLTETDILARNSKTLIEQQKLQMIHELYPSSTLSTITSTAATAPRFTCGNASCVACSAAGAPAAVKSKTIEAATLNQQDVKQTGKKYAEFEDVSLAEPEVPDALVHVAPASRESSPVASANHNHHGNHDNNAATQHHFVNMLGAEMSRYPLYIDDLDAVPHTLVWVPLAQKMEIDQLFPELFHRPTPDLSPFKNYISGALPALYEQYGPVVAKIVDHIADHVALVREKIKTLEEFQLIEKQRQAEAEALLLSADIHSLPPAPINELANAFATKASLPASLTVDDVPELLTTLRAIEKLFLAVLPRLQPYPSQYLSSILTAFPEISAPTTNTGVRTPFMAPILSSLLSTDCMSLVPYIQQFVKIPLLSTFTLNPPECWPTSGHISISGMVLAYRQGLPAVLRGVNVDIPKGFRVGLVGRTGAGKSSMFGALLALFRNDFGRVCLDGIDTKHVPLAVLRKAIATIPQTPTLFSGTIRSNLDHSARASDDEIWDALDKVGLSAKVQAFGGLDFELLDKGSNLSAGEQQLLCIARTIIKKRKIVLIDEATANCDPASDQQIQQALKHSFKDCTMIVIAHRLQTIMDSDMVIVLDKGQVVECGHPDVLKQQGGVFASMFEAQKHA